MLLVAQIQLSRILYERIACMSKPSPPSTLHPLTINPPPPLPHLQSIQSVKSCVLCNQPEESSTCRANQVTEETKSFPINCGLCTATNLFIVTFTTKLWQQLIRKDYFIINLMENSNTLLLTEVRKSLSISKSGRGKIQLPETNGKVADLPRNGKNYFF